MTTTKNSNKTRIIFCGIVAGYDSRAVSCPALAAQTISRALIALGVETKVSPAVCVYHTDWGCPRGGEAVGAFYLPEEGALNLSEKLRKELSQSTLSVCMHTQGVPTLGFTARLAGDLVTVGKRWQQLAAEEMSITGLYVSCGIAEEDGNLVISAEANPAFVQDIGLWRKVAERICAQLGCKPEFEDCGFNYLK